LRHLADNEIDSDSFAVTHGNENGKETECELSITDFALRAAADVDAMLDALSQRDAQIAALAKQPPVAYTVSRVIEALSKGYLGTVTVCPDARQVSPVPLFLHAAPPAPVVQNEVAEVARAALDYIDALPSDVVASLPAMPGFDRGWADGALSLTAAPPAPVKLPSLKQTISGERYTWSDGVYNYQQDVIGILKAAGVVVEVADE